MDEQSPDVTSLDRLQRWATRSRPRFAVVSGVPVVVIVGAAAILAGLAPGVVIAVAVGAGVLAAVIAVGVVWAERLADPELRALNAQDSALVRSALGSRAGAVAVDRRLRPVAARVARRGLVRSRRLRPAVVGIGLLLIAYDVYQAVLGDPMSWIFVLVPIGFVALAVSGHRRLRAVLGVLEEPGVSANGPPAPPAPRATP